MTLANSFLTVFLFIYFPLFGIKYNGTIRFGSFIAKEEFNGGISGSGSNNKALFSSRFRTVIKESFTPFDTLSIDFRDKYDLFSKVDKERLELQDENRFQVRHLLYENFLQGKSVHYRVGRFSVIEAGEPLIDGISLDTKFIVGLRLGAFGGMNLKKDDTFSLERDKRKTSIGLYTTFEENKKSWGNYIYTTNGYTVNRYRNDIDRAYLFHHLIYHSIDKGRFVSQLTLDFVPVINIQYLNLSFFKPWNSMFSSNLYLSSVDSTLYTRYKDIRERLESSRYKELGGSIKVKMNDLYRITLRVSHGKREKDNLFKTVVDCSLDSRFGVFLWNVDLGRRWRFERSAYLFRFGGAFNGKHTQVKLTEELSLEKEGNAGNDLARETVLSFSTFLWKSYFLSLSLQYAKDKNVDVKRGFFIAGMRFGGATLEPNRMRRGEI